MSQLYSLPGEAACTASTRFEKREQQMARIREAATKCFVRSGFSGASMNEICREAQMSPGALYRYFPSKEAIVEAIIDEDRRRDIQLLSQMAQRDDVVEALVEGFVNHMQMVHATGFASLFAEVRAEALRNDEVAVTRDRTLCQVRCILTEFLRSAIERGEIDPVVPLDDFLTILIAFSEGAIVSDLLKQGVDTCHIETVVRRMIIANLRPTDMKAQ